MATTKYFMTVLMVLLIPTLNDICVLGDDDCDSSEEDNLAYALTDCETELYRCCQDRQSNGVSAPICAVIPCNGWRGVFYDRCNLIQFKCRYYSYRFREYYQGTPGYWMNECHDPSAYVFKDILDCSRFPGFDTMAPVIYPVPNDITTRTDIGKPTAVVQWVPPYAYDDSPVTLTSNWYPGWSFPIGVRTVVYTAVDASGNEAKVSFTVTVKDKEDPVIKSSLPDVLHLKVPPGQRLKVVQWDQPDITDNSGRVELVESNKHSGDIFPVGLTEVTYHAEDPYQNSADFSFDVLITYQNTSTDTTAPVIYPVPSDITTTTDIGRPTAVVRWASPAAYDVSSVTLTSNWYSGSAFPIGDTTVTYTAVDAFENVAVESFRVTVKDKEAPIIMSSLPPVIKEKVPPGQRSKVVYWQRPSITDNSGRVKLVESNYHSGDVFPVGLTEVTYHAEDPYQNSADFSFDILITYEDGTPQPCSCDIAESISYCQLGVESQAQMTVRCKNGSKYFTKSTDCRCRKKPPTFPDCSFPMRLTTIIRV